MITLDSKWQKQDLNLDPLTPKLVFYPLPVPWCLTMFNETQETHATIKILAWIKFDRNKKPYICVQNKKWILQVQNAGVANINLSEKHQGILANYQLKMNQQYDTVAKNPKCCLCLYGERDKVQN